MGHQPPRRSCRTLPNGAQPQISPESPIGEIYRYRVIGPPGYSVTDLKTLEDWVLERRFKAVPGVIDVTGWGGMTRPTRSRSTSIGSSRISITLPQVLQVLDNSNLNVGGQTINIGPQSAVVRGVGLIHSMDDIRNTMLSLEPRHCRCWCATSRPSGRPPAAPGHRRPGSATTTSSRASC